MQCVQHPHAPASYRCDGCQLTLCSDCVEEGHRLIFCRLCGELALPLAPTVAATTTVAARQRRLEHAYSFQDALAYPLRGNGLYVLGAYIGVTAFFAMTSVLPGFGLVGTGFSFLVFGLIASMIFSIVNRTADGDDAMPGWPDWDLFARLGDLLRMLLISLLSALPTLLLLSVLGCGLGAVFEGTWGWHCSFLLVVGAALGSCFWVVAVGATAIYETTQTVFRFDLHLAALGIFGRQVLSVVALLVGLTVVGQILEIIASVVPLLGSLLQVAISTYTLFVSAHLIGLLFRRHADAIDKVYLGSM